MIHSSDSEDNDSDVEGGLELRSLDPISPEWKNGFFSQVAVKNPEEDAYKEKLKQVYVYVARCIAHPFNTKQSAGPGYRYMNVNDQVLTKMKDQFRTYLANNDIIAEKDQVFIDSVRWFYNVFLTSDRAVQMTKSGGYTTKDFQHVFKKKIYQLVCQLPDDQEMSTMELLSDWITDYDEIVSQSSEEHDRRLTSTEAHLNKAQLFNMFQKILGFSSYEHKILSQACQLHIHDEQVSAVRRELDQRLAQVNSGQKPPFQFIHHDMAAQYREEERKLVKSLKEKLLAVPMKADRSQAQFDGVLEKSGKSLLCKHDIVLNFTVEVEVMEVKGLEGVKGLSPDRQAYCSMELEGAANGKVLCTDRVPQSSPVWTNKADFETRQPLPTVKIRLLTETNNPFLFEGRPIGKKLFKPTPETLSDKPVWGAMEAEVDIDKEGTEKTNSNSGAAGLEIKTCVRMDKPQNMKLGSNMFIKATTIWRKWKKRYLVLVQVSPYVFALCYYIRKQTCPKGMLTLEGYTVNYQLPDNEHAVDSKFQFRLVREGEEVICGADNLAQMQNWVNALYRATGQTTKPELSEHLTGNDSANDIRRLGMDELTKREPITSPQDELYRTLQRLTLEYRMNKESTAARGWLSPGQEFVLKEYAARYGIRYVSVHLSYLRELIDYANAGFVIDPKKLHDMFKNCCNHMQGRNSDDGVWTVTKEEFVEFYEVKSMLKDLLMTQITTFRNSFPFGRPDGALKTTILLLEQVLTNKIELQVDCCDLEGYEDSEYNKMEVCKQTKRCLEEGAYSNYLQLTADCHLCPETATIDEMVVLANLCIELLHETLDYYAEALNGYDRLMCEMNETFWMFYGRDMEANLRTKELGSPEVLPLFHTLNEYLYDEQELRYGRFHTYLHEVFAPHVVQYLEREECNLREELEEALQRETWTSDSGLETSEEYSCSAVQQVVAQLKHIQKFVAELRWPDKQFSEHLQNRIQRTTAEIIDYFVAKTAAIFDTFLQGNIITVKSVLPDEACVMINSCITLRNKATELCGTMAQRNPNNSNSHTYREDINTVLGQRINNMFNQCCKQLDQCLQVVLSKLARYDPSFFFSMIFSVVPPKLNMVEPLFSFVRQNNVQMKQEIHASCAQDLLLCWYNTLLSSLSSWLSDREEMNLHPFQLVALSTILKTLFTEFSSQGLKEDVLRHQDYRRIHTRIEYEETMNIEHSRSYSIYEASSGSSETDSD